MGYSNMFHTFLLRRHYVSPNEGKEGGHGDVLDPDFNLEDAALQCAGRSIQVICTSTDKATLLLLLQNSFRKRVE